MYVCVCVGVGSCFCLLGQPPREKTHTKDEKNVHIKKEVKIKQRLQIYTLKYMLLTLNYTERICMYMYVYVQERERKRESVCVARKTHKAFSICYMKLTRTYIQLQHYLY